MLGFPSAAARFFENINIMHFSVSAHHRVHRNTDSIYDMSFMFDLSVLHNRHGLSVHYGTRMLEHDEFDSFANHVNGLYKDANMPLLYGEKHYVVSSLVNAKARSNRREQARDIALYHLSSSEANAHVVFAIRSAANVGIRFSNSQINTITNVFEQVRYYFTSNDHCEFFVVVLANRLFEMSATLYQLTNNGQFANYANNFLSYLPMP